MTDNYFWIVVFVTRTKIEAKATGVGTPAGVPIAAGCRSVNSEATLIASEYCSKLKMLCSILQNLIILDALLHQKYFWKAACWEKGWPQLKKNRCPYKKNEKLHSKQIKPGDAFDSNFSF